MASCRRRWRWRARDGDGLLHTLAAIEPDERMANFLSRQTLYVADGHHRYETALAYQAEVRSHPERTDAPAGALEADWVMAVLVNAELEELEIRPTHRLLLRADPDALREVGVGGGQAVGPGEAAQRGRQHRHQHTQPAEQVQCRAPPREVDAHYGQSKPCR